jgi:hypothetical protein
MKKTIHAMAAAVAILLAGTALAQEKAQKEYPGTVFELPVITEQAQENDDNDYEMETDLPFFVENGWDLPNWDAYYRFRHEAAKEIVLPDYVRRTGKLPPDDALIDIAPVFVTGGDFNDMLVASHLPDDCDQTGCIVQLYATKDGKSWDKRLEFKSLSVAYKKATDKDASAVVAVGNEEYPNVIYTWTGVGFQQSGK